MKIVLYFKKLNIGGAERSTVRLINAFIENGIDVTLFVWTKGGKLENELSSKVNIMHFFHDTGALQDWDRTKRGLFKVKTRNLSDAAIQYLLGSIRKLVYRIRKPKFDLAITGWHGYNPKILKNYTRYGLHIQMIRNENAISVNDKPQSFIKNYAKNLDIVDAYICVSEQLRQMMIRYCNLPSERVLTIYNVIEIDRNFKQDCSYPVEYTMCSDDEVKITTICRLVDGPKGLIRMVNVCSELKKKHYKFKWFVVGDGVDKGKMKNAIEENNIADCMILCGFRQNPISYYVHSDLIAVLSYVEGLSGTVNEAKLLERPIITTRFSSIEEQIQQGVNGHIVENNEDAIIIGMELLLKDKSYRDSLAKNSLPEILQDNDYKIEQFLRLYQVKKNKSR